MRRLVGIVGAALLFVVPAIALTDRFGRSWEARISVRGHSMEPTLNEGDWLLVDPGAYVSKAPRLGDLVVAHDPRDTSRTIIKRVAGVGSDGALTVAGDHPAHAEEAQSIGMIERSALLGRPWFRYWPAGRIGRI